jgi:hypothetical protein
VLLDATTDDISRLPPEWLHKGRFELREWAAGRTVPAD